MLRARGAANSLVGVSSSIFSSYKIFADLSNYFSLSKIFADRKIFRNMVVQTIHRNGLRMSLQALSVACSVTVVTGMSIGFHKMYIYSFAIAIWWAFCNAQL